MATFREHAGEAFYWWAIAMAAIHAGDYAPASECMRVAESHADAAIRASRPTSGTAWQPGEAERKFRRVMARAATIRSH